MEVLEAYADYFSRLLKEQKEAVKKWRSEGWIVDVNPYGLGYLMFKPPGIIKEAKKLGITPQELWDTKYAY